MPNVAFKRPEVQKKTQKWGLIRDSIEGEETIKSKGEEYLPKPNPSDKSLENIARYEAYLKRAVYYNVVGRTAEGLLGQVFSKDPSIELPPSIEFFEEDINGMGTSLEQQAKAALANNLATGRGGFLSDFPPIEDGEVITKADIENGLIRPRVIEYPAEQIINWRETTIGGETILTLLVLTEEKIVSEDEFEFKTEPRWRVLKLNSLDDGDGFYATVEVWREKKQCLDSTERIDQLKRKP
jgi:hypothetical protein